MKIGKIFHLTGLCFCLSTFSIQGQIIPNAWIEYMEDLSENTEDTERIETLYADLSYLTEHPFDLNRVNREELRRLPFLNDYQIDGLIAFRERYGKLLSVYELKNVETLDFQTISLLLPFVRIESEPVDKRPISVHNLLKYGRNELQIRYDRGFQQKKGYRSQPDSILQQYPNRQYLGEPFYHSLRYSYTFDKRIQMGFIGEKDAGEPFWNRHHKGYDYYSAHFFMKNHKRFKSLAVGDYKVSFGQGLVISHDFTPSRSAVVAQAERRVNGFRRHFSTNEFDYLRGVAATLVYKKVEVSLFYSYRKMDAGVNDKTFTSLKIDGLHRLVRDREKLRTIPMQTFGGNIRYVSPDFCVGITSLAYTFGDYSMQPNPAPYNLYYFRGNNNVNISMDYLFKRRKIKLYGETALSKNGAVATLNAMQLTPVSYFSFLLLHRYYDRRYQALFGNAFTQGSSVQNEQGTYMGMQFTPFPYWKLSVYADVFRFPWLKYGIDAPSTGKEYMGQIDYVGSDAFSAYVRYKYKQKEKNQPGENAMNRILPYTQQRFRVQLRYGLFSCFTFRTSFDGIHYKEESGEPAKGMMLAQSMGWKPDSFPLQTDLYIAWFNTDNYSTRISSYEKNILYAFYMPSFYGRGYRLAATLRWDIIQPLSFSLKISHTRYADRDIIGTDLEEITGSNKTDLYGLLRWKF